MTNDACPEDIFDQANGDVRRAWAIGYARGFDAGFAYGQLTSNGAIWQTRDGRNVRIVCTDKPGDWPIMGYFIDDEAPASFDWKLDGAYLDDRGSDSDLIIPDGSTIGKSE